MSVNQSEAFLQAAEDSKKLTSKPSNDELLELYGLFKVGTGEDFSKATVPGIFDLKGKAKYNAWKKNIEEDTPPTAAEAQERYVVLVDRLKKKYGYDPTKVPEAVGSA
jgi:diazepam-binding inhibitor (GABA receptor modulating acyl-CoA-binding protein)